MELRVDYDYLATEYAYNRRIHPGVFAQLLTAAALCSPHDVLEVGCGTGNYCRALAEAGGYPVYGIDPSPEMLAHAIARLPTGRFELGHAAALPWPDSQFGLVFSVDVIHHVRSPEAYFAEAYRVLSPGGVICTATDSTWIIKNRCPLSTYFPETVAVELQRYHTVEALRDSMRQTGFEEMREEMVEFSYLLTDLRPYRKRAFSSLHLIPDDAWRRGLARLEADLDAGPVVGNSRYVLLWGAAKPAVGASDGRFMPFRTR